MPPNIRAMEARIVAVTSSRCLRRALMINAGVPVVDLVTIDRAVLVIGK
ncbi:MAG TPA: hypothetical protein VNT27_07810 [Propionibacteriaceae bacterium]|nr:hypothetical protein [Propionibacteriaceae bacterium]